MCSRSNTPHIMYLAHRIMSHAPAIPAVGFLRSTQSGTFGFMLRQAANATTFVITSIRTALHHHLRTGVLHLLLVRVKSDAVYSSDCIRIDPMIWKWR